MARWLVPVVTFLALVVQSVGTYAAAGVKTDVHCCCPSPEVCKCHPDKHAPTNRLERCSGAVHVDAPIAVATIVPVSPVRSAVVATAAPQTTLTLAIPVERTIEPEKPPF